MFSSNRISGKQIGSNYRQSKIVNQTLAKGGDKVLRTATDRREFWRAIKQESQSHEGGRKSFTNKDVKTFFGKMMRNKSDRFSDQKIKALAKIFNPHGKAYVYDGASAAKTVPAQPEKNVATREQPAQDRQKRYGEIMEKRDATNHPSEKPVTQNHVAQAAPRLILKEKKYQAASAAAEQHANKEQTINHFGIRGNSEQASQAKDMIARIMGNGKSDNHDGDILDKAA